MALRAEADPAADRETTFRWTTAATVSDDLNLLADKVGELSEQWPHPIRSVGVAMPATVDRSGRVTVWPNRPSWTGLDLGAALGTLFPSAEVRWADDGDLAAVAEADATDVEDLLYLGVGTGIGGGIVIGGRPVPGPSRGSCEVGHMIVSSSGPVCDCGRVGCLQAVASGSAILRGATRLRGSDVSFEDLCAGLRLGHAWAVTPVGAACSALASAIVGISELVRPACAVIGGGVPAGLPGFIAQVSRQAEALSRPGHPAPPVRASVLGGLSSLRGAVLLARSAA